MDRQWLARELERGRSLSDIAREVGRHPSTVSYWMAKHGLRSRHVRPYSPRGGIAEDDLRDLVGRGLSLREIAAETGFSPTAVRHWLRRFGLRTERARHVIRGQALRECRVHGLTTYRRVGSTGSLRCPQCMSERVARRRRRAKEILVAEFGGRCAPCGYDRCGAALHFHHLNPSEKRLSFAERGLTRSLATLRQEAENCVLLCANCHAEVEAGRQPPTLPR